MRSRLSTSAAILAALGLFIAGQAQADVGSDDEGKSGAIVVPLNEAATSADLHEEAAILAAQRGQESYRSDGTYAHTGEEWRYNTYYIFPLVRHMPDSGLPKWGQWVTYPFAAIIDLGQLPVGALGGLFGD
jgi:hypothetical protein